MRMTAEPAVALTFDHGLPTTLNWQDQIWVVIDHPTPLVSEVEWLHPLITHAPEPQVGWRFTARPIDGGDACVLDVQRAGSEWRLCCVWQ